MHRPQQAITEIFGSDSHSPDAVRWRQSVLRAAQYDCGTGYTSVRGQTIHACPFYGPCRALPAHEAALCEFGDEEVGIDTTAIETSERKIRGATTNDAEDDWYRGEWGKLT